MGRGSSKAGKTKDKTKSKFKGAFQKALSPGREPLALPPGREQLALPSGSTKTWSDEAREATSKSSLKWYEKSYSDNSGIENFNAAYVLGYNKDGEEIQREYIIRNEKQLIIQDSIGAGKHRGRDKTFNSYKEMVSYAEKDLEKGRKRYGK